tara:strand:+ start:5434 stop:5637 length:204 start_codon:yes stop_codon:yes gene_type:complete
MDRNFLYKSKKQFAEEVAAIKPLEIFDIDSCGITWEQLFRKHLAFDVIKCGECSACLKDVIGESCNC